MRILILSGKSGSGKSTVANHLEANHGFTEIAFADCLKSLVSLLFNVPVACLYDQEFKEKAIPGFENWTYRTALQFIGTELFRKQFDDKIWVKILINEMRRCSAVKNWVISDARFGDEVSLLREAFPEANVLDMRMERPGLPSVGLSGHESEKLEFESSWIMSNHRSVDDLKIEIDGLVKNWK